MGLLAFISGCFGGNKPEISQLDEIESKFLTENFKLGYRLLVKVLGEQEKFELLEIDRAVSIIRDDFTGYGYTHDQVIEQIGTYLGEVIKSELPVQWFTYTDKRGKDYILVHEEIAVFTFPYSAIYKALIEGRNGALEEVFNSFKEQIDEHIDSAEVERVSS